MADGSAILSVRGLKVSYGSVAAVVGADFEIWPGETLALVGESGSGKSSAAMAVPRLLAEPPARIEAESIRLCGRELAGLDRAALRPLRGAEIGVVFQDPMTALSPLHRIGSQIEEAVLLHRKAGRSELKELVRWWLERVGIREPERVARAYPHELSGGMQQRVMIAMALVNNPRLLIADEPTTALDAITQSKVLDLMKGLVGKDRAMLLVTHDMGVVRKMADRVAVMHEGSIVETAPCKEIFERPSHPYTKMLMKWCREPVIRHAGEAPTMSTREHSETPAIAAEGVRVWYGGGEVKAVDGVSFRLAQGETLAIVGESGSGKTTLSRALLGLAPLHSGSIDLFGKDPAAASATERRALRRRLQVVFQDPFASLNPRHTVLELVTGAMTAQKLCSRREAPTECRRLLAEVGLPGDILDRHPHAFSGGQRQRIAIARALSLSPDAVICDEAVSALDVSVRAQVLDLLLGLRDRRGLAYLFITHDIGVAGRMADRVAVMHCGRFVETGDAQSVLRNPQSPYTRELLAASLG